MTLEDITISLDLAKKLKELGVDRPSMFFWGISEYETDNPELTTYKDTETCEEDNCSRYPGIWSYSDIEIGNYKELYPAYCTEELVAILADDTLKIIKDEKSYCVTLYGITEIESKLCDALAMHLIRLIENKSITLKK